jgi:Rrf2 family nitric oxide-sensitive transcriptional repressor
MQLTRFSDLGLRVLMYLTQHERPETVTISEIATQFDVPVNHLTKVVHRLGQLGWVSTLRGRKGGLRLARPAVDIRVGEVVRAMEGHEALIDCEGLQCRLTGACLLRGALKDALDAFYHSLDRHSLADICAGRTGEAIIRMHRQFLADSPPLH